MTANSLTSKEFGRRFRKALSVPFLLDQVCSVNIKEFVTSYAESLGCSEKSFFFPLLTCTAACMGMDAHIELTTHWQEPPLLWTLVISPRSLQRVDVAEHIKQQILQAQNEAWVIGKNEDTKEYLKKFLFDFFTLSQLQDMLKLSNGHGLAIYNSVRSLHKNMLQPEEADIMLRLHSGLAWFSDSRVSRSTVARTRMNFAILSTPSTVHQTLVSAPNFQELFHQCFLTTASEETHVKFSQISQKSEVEKLREIFVSLLKLHYGGEPIVYKLSAEGKEKFEQIHDELTDKAKQMARKNAHKVFQPALSYLARLSCILHVLDGVIDAINYKVPVSRLTWNTEIGAGTVWQARELLGHVVEQRHALMEPTTIETAQRPQQQHPIQIVDGQNVQRSPQMQQSPRAMYTPPNMRSPMQNHAPSPGFHFNNNVRRNLNYNRTRPAAPLVRNNFGGAQNGIARQQPVSPIIASVHSGGVTVAVGNGSASTFNPVISSCESVGGVNSGRGLPRSLSVSRSDDGGGPPALLSRAPFTSVLDTTEEDFLSAHKNSLKKLLRHSVSDVTPSRCMQLKLTPDPTASDEAQRYTSSFARSFLKRVEKLGFGLCDGPTNNNMRHFVFKKKKFSALGDDQKRILGDMGITEADYNKCFTSGSKDQNGKLVCLE